MPMQIRPLEQNDKPVWLTLWQGYLKYYRTGLPQTVTEACWHKIMDAKSGIHGLGAYTKDGGLIGFAHYIFHPVTWSETPRCYLEDLFTSRDARGQGAGGALIDAVTKAARAENADQLFWLTESYNERAQALYDKVATRTHFIKYVKAL